MHREMHKPCCEAHVNGLERIIKDVNAEVKVNKAKVNTTTAAEGGKAGPLKKGVDSTSHVAAALLTTTLSGKGCLTHERMKKRSSYYRKAIMENAPDVNVAHHAVWPFFFHCQHSMALTTPSAQTPGATGKSKRWTSNESEAGET